MSKKSITIFGSTGNLMYKKLIPALSNLIAKGHLEQGSKIYCVARRDWDLETYIEEAKKQVKESIDWDRLIPYLSFVKFDIKNVDDYYNLRLELEEEGIEDSIFYLAVPPQLFPVISKGISEAGLIKKGDDLKRIVFEKPFGEDLESAKAINKELWQFFDESQIYRIDHYLGKEMIQNILIVRFANAILQNAWNKDSIESVWIVAKETEGVMQRAGYYDTIGALKDMLQSHLLQMASLVAMNKPNSYKSDDIKDEKVKVLKKIKIRPKDIILGQYDGYLQEYNVGENSSTETFVFAEASIDDDNWRGVPFYFMTGKMLDEKRSEIIVNFRDQEEASLLWPDQSRKRNQLRIEVAPEEGVIFQFNVKEQGLSENIVPARLDYCHNCSSLENSPEAYEKLLLDLLGNHRTLFTRWDEIETTWAIVRSIINNKKNPYIYKDYQDIIEEVNRQFGDDFIDL
jgi:glucose-6-phosphate 1-dehydrogenase